MNISIMGAGAFGRALGKILSDNGHGISFYDPNVAPDVTLEQALKDADTVVIAIPSNFLPSFIENYPAAAKKIPTVLGSKGLVNVDLFKDFSEFSVVSGPAFAEEIMEGQPATLTISSQKTIRLFENKQVKTEFSPDVLGIVLCGSLKNAYAIGCGYYDESDNARAQLLTEAHRETQKYLLEHGANSETADLACGIGDLILTCSSRSSRNYTCGMKLSAGIDLDDIINELKTIEGINALHDLDTDNYPLLDRIAKLAKLKAA